MAKLNILWGTYSRYAVLIVALVILILLTPTPASAWEWMPGPATPWNPYGGLDQCDSSWIGQVGNWIKGHLLWGTP